MSSLESFYGGRQGASFIIVKRFDGLDIPEDTIYRYRWFAQDANGYFYVPLIERTGNNYTVYSHWNTIPCDGVTTVISQDGLESEPLPIEYQEGMRQCFEKGGVSTSIVNYGEYVIIDTIAGLGESSNPDNGKIYRRGMNYDYNAITNPLCGAEYIGQIVGPKGSSPELEMYSVQDILDQPGTSIHRYMPQAGDSENGIVPGKYVDAQDVVHYNDTIDYAWATVKDNRGNITGAWIGFNFPYLVPEISGNWRKPYYTQEDYDAGRISDASLIGHVIPVAANFDLFVDNGLNTADRDPNHGDTGHPFYRKWKINIPKGIKGDTANNLEIYPTKVRDGSIVYTRVENNHTLSKPKASPAQNLNLDLSHYDETKTFGYCAVDEGGYVYLTDTYGAHLRYLETIYDNLEIGEKQWIDLGEYNIVKNITLDTNGTLTVVYSNHDTYETYLPWIDNVEIDADGTIHFYYNNGAEKTPLITPKIKYINNIFIDTDGSGGEGDGDQKVHVVYNTVDIDGHNEEAILGRPINYIVETAIPQLTEDINQADANHLLVYFSDPAYRAYLATEYPSRIKTYQGFKDSSPKSGWFDLGYVKGESGGIHIIGNVLTPQDLLDNQGNPIPPEDIMGNPDHAGWVMTVGDPANNCIIYAYDYDAVQWYPIGSLNVIDPTTIIDNSSLIQPPANLNINGYWLVTNTRTVVE